MCVTLNASIQFSLVAAILNAHSYLVSIHLERLIEPIQCKKCWHQNNYANLHYIELVPFSAVGRSLEESRANHLLETVCRAS